MTAPRSFARGVAATIACALLPAGSAEGQIVNLNGLVINACVLTVATPGTIAASPSGTQLSSTATGGIAALLTVVATGTNPTITFSAAGLTGPSAGTSTAELAYTSPGGATRGYSSAGYVYGMTQLLDSITINGRATNSNGFQSGVYALTTTATCSQ